MIARQRVKHLTAMLQQRGINSHLLTGRQTQQPLRVPRREGTVPSQPAVKVQGTDHDQCCTRQVPSQASTNCSQRTL